MWKGEKKRPWKPRAQRESCLGLQAWRVGHTLSPAPASEFRPKSCLDIPQAPPTPWVPYSGAGSTFGPQPCHEPALVPGDAPPSPLAALYLIDQAPRVTSLHLAVLEELGDVLALTLWLRAHPHPLRHHPTTSALTSALLLSPTSKPQRTVGLFSPASIPRAPQTHLTLV